MARHAGSGLDELARAYADRGRAAGGGGRAVGCVGPDIPRELVEACGLVPVRLPGDPRQDTALASQILGGGVDEVTTTQLAGLLAGQGPRLRGLLISHDSEDSVRLYQALRELARAEPGRRLPPAAFVDVLHGPAVTSLAYTRLRLSELARRLGEWGGRAASRDGLTAAIAAGNAQRQVLERVRRLRRATPARLSGSQMARVAGAAMFLTSARHTALLRMVLDQAGGLAAHSGPRLFLTGSDHDHPQVCEAAEQLGYHVAGEDHDWGDAVASVAVPTDGDPLDALARAYGRGLVPGRRAGPGQRAAATAALAAQAGADIVLAYIRQGDDARAWDVPAVRAALRRDGRPLAVLERQPYHWSDEDALRRELRRALSQAALS